MYDLTNLFDCLSAVLPAVIFSFDPAASISWVAVGLGIWEESG